MLLLQGLQNAIIFIPVAIVLSIDVLHQLSPSLPWGWQGCRTPVSPTRSPPAPADCPQILPKLPAPTAAWLQPKPSMMELLPALVSPSGLHKPVPVHDPMLPPHPGVLPIICLCFTFRLKWFSLLPWQSFIPLHPVFHYETSFQLLKLGSTQLSLFLHFFLVLNSKCNLQLLNKVSLLCWKVSVGHQSLPFGTPRRNQFTPF